MTPILIKIGPLQLYDPPILIKIGHLRSEEDTGKMYRTPPPRDKTSRLYSYIYIYMYIFVFVFSTLRPTKNLKNSHILFILTPFGHGKTFADMVR
jgi:hypothetical protein